jgi:hypothetical protein
MFDQQSNGMDRAVDAAIIKGVTPAWIVRFTSAPFAIAASSSAKRSRPAASKIAGIVLSAVIGIFYRYPEEGFCDLLVYDSRKYPEFLTDDYCSSVQPSQVKARLFSVPKIELSQDYHLSV